MKRNLSIELFRVLLMFGICLLHSNGRSVDSNPYLAYLLLPCVNGFVFISGWYGIKFSFGKCGKIVLNSLYAGIVAVGLAYFIMPELLSPTKECFKVLRHVFIGQWFFMSYLVLMLVSPAVNSFVDLIDEGKFKLTVLPVFLVLCFWNWMPDLAWNHFIESPKGFGMYTPATLMLTYAFARLCRKFGWIEHLPTVKLACAIAVVAVILVAGGKYGFAEYSSPFAMLFAGLLFAAFSRMNHSVSLCGWLSPSLFTVYLYHSHVEFGFKMLDKVQQGLGANVCTGTGGGVIVLSAVLVFWAGIVLDLPRRTVLCILSWDK